MTTREQAEFVEPADVSEGDVVEDPASGRSLTIREIQVASSQNKDVFSFYGNGPDDRVTVSGREKVRRKNDVSDDKRPR